MRNKAKESVVSTENTICKKCDSMRALISCLHNCYSKMAPGGVKKDILRYKTKSYTIQKYKLLSIWTLFKSYPHLP